jgi:hypothetical protein
MKFFALALGIYLGICSYTLAQSSAGSASAGSSGAAGAGSTLSNGSTISGAGGSPGPNTANALNKGRTGTNLGAPRTDNVPSAATHGNAVDTPAAKSAVQNLGNTDRHCQKVAVSEMAERMRCILRNQARRSLPWAEKGRDRRFCAFGTKGAFLNSQRQIAFLEIGAPQPGTLQRL